MKGRGERAHKRKLILEDFYNMHKNLCVERNRVGSRRRKEGLILVVLRL